MTPRFREARDVRRVVRIEAILELASPCHLGGADSDATSDRPLVRDANGRPYLPGTTIKGLLRASLPPRDAELLLGSTGDDDPRQARLLVDDAPIGQPGSVPTEVRDGVAIDAALGIAADKEKWDIELLPAGTRFELGLELLLPVAGDDSALRGVALQVLWALETGEVRVGARTSRGFGSVVTTGGWNVTEFDLATREGLFGHLARDLDPPPPDFVSPATRIYGNVAALAAAWGRPVPSDLSSGGWTVGLHLAVDGSLLVRSAGYDPGAPDNVHLLRPERASDGAQKQPVAVLPGSSLAGALRSRCLRIARTLAPPRSTRPDELVEGLFGPKEIKGRRRERSQEPKAFASPLEVDEAKIVGGRALRHTRVRIDPWTGGAAETLLFTEDPWFGGRIDVALRCRAGRTDEAVRKAHVALLLMAVRDLGTGDLCVGGQASVGRGRMCPGRSDGTFAVFKDAAREVTLRLRHEASNEVVVVEPAGALDGELEALRLCLAGGTS